jgi:hypothetical protein
MPDPDVRPGETVPAGEPPSPIAPPDQYVACHHPLT